MDTEHSRPNLVPTVVRMAFGSKHDGANVRFSIATLVNDKSQYEAMCASFQSGGFSSEDCEYLYIDNTGDQQTCAYRGLNTMLAEARGSYVVLCHQDVRLLADDRTKLERLLAGLDKKDSSWAVAGNAGGVAPGVLAIRITDPHGADQSVGTFPQRVTSLDENFIIVRRCARIGFSNDLTGFHFYGADLCLHAELAGYSAYVIDFHLVHLSAGSKSGAFQEMEKKFREKWSRALTPRWIQTTCALIRISSDTVGRIAGRIIEQPFAKIARRFPSSRGWT